MSNQLRLQVLGTLAFVHLTEVLDERAYLRMKRSSSGQPELGMIQLRKHFDNSSNNHPSPTEPLPSALRFDSLIARQLEANPAMNASGAVADGAEAQPAV